MIKDSRVLVVSYDHNGKDEAVLIVFERSHDSEDYDVVKLFTGQDASDLYGILSGMEEQK